MSQTTSSKMDRKSGFARNAQMTGSRECADLIIATTSFMWSMGLKTREERGEYIRMGNESNRKRDDGRRWANPNDKA